MATLSHFHFLTFLSLPSRKLYLLPQQHLQQNKLHCETQEHPPPKQFTTCALSNKKPSSRTRKVKSNEELCNDIQQFLTEFGFPEDHVPSTKELSLHGRNDLANIVRRRGYKLIRELLANSTTSNNDGLDPKKSFDENQGAIGDHEHILAGQDKKANTLVVEHISSTDISTVGNNYISPSSDLDFNSGDFRSLPVESSSNLFLEEKVSHRIKGHDEKVKDVAENAFLSTEVSTMESSSINFDLNTDENSCMPVELSVLEEKTSSNLQVEDKKVNNMVEDVAFSNEGKKHYSWSSNPDFNPTDFKSMPIESPISLSLEERPSYNLKDQDEKIKNNNVPLYSSEDSRMPIEFSENSSLEEKVTKFIQNGDLDMIEDNAYGILNERVAEESKEFIQPQNLVVQPAEEHSGNSLNGGSVGSTLTSKDVTPAALVTQPLRDDHVSPGLLMTAKLDKDLDTGSSIRERQADINHLKFMLHQKELELSLLKEQIGKEKLALSDLQTKAEAEISKAQKLISEKDAELQAAEGSLSGLEEVSIQYFGEGEIVEVSGSFNGWHQRIKMDPQPSSSITDPNASRNSRLWSTVLWLYPGTYEIKFIVDGHWRTDPRRESVTTGTICNNILRVDK
ncbi:protein PTST homolog 3, chloroplastic isoform X1 [Quercus robur]|uniref:protein PTST homolog 3, chloroplastic isoform X1 n=1 Tax=Quercus robur TaxID=38942 RepID=UPI0021621C54|nr:protein PTST homolog 3, chloroplastic isoform X1 [Quercus robur]XP_050243181.1 protein PTST homolog 3, chloroplastic isoform X1 [Quercus robur]XP_050243182.1 protein PTST homolog 3, chloroplastic isoform X1 [Quercus robur]